MTGGMAQVVEPLPSTYEALCSTSTTTKKSINYHYYLSVLRLPELKDIIKFFID
jgi:hypothetical protein